MSPLEASGRSALAAEQLGAAEALTMSLIGEAEVAARTGRLTEALELSSRADQLTELVPLGATYNAVVRFLVLLHLDRPAEADECCRQLEALLDERDEGTARTWLLHLHGIRHLGLGRPEAAARLYLKAEQLFEQLGIGEPCVVPWAGRAVIAHARAGRDADAARVLGWLDSCAARLPCRYPRVAAAFGRAELAVRHGDHQASERHFRDALVLHDDAELPMERASTLLAYGNDAPPERSAGPGPNGAGRSARHGRGHGRAGPGPIRPRRVVLDRREAPPPQPLTATSPLRSCGSPGWSRAGNSRRDIAERLTLSEATVRTHLEHIYTKLDIHSARELMTSKLDQLADSDQP